MSEIIEARWDGLIDCGTLRRRTTSEIGAFTLAAGVARSRRFEMDGNLVKKSEIDAMKGTAKEHFLNSNARRINKSLGDLTGIKGFGFHIIEVQPGRESTEFHVHAYEDECVYVLAGSATAVIGDSEIEVSEGDFIGYRAGGLAHSLRNTGDSVLRCIVVGQRLDHDLGGFPRLKKRVYRNVGLSWDVVDLDNITHPGPGVGSK